MNYQKLVLAGNATADAQQNKSKKGDVAYTTFSLGVNDAKNRANFFPIVAFGKLGEAAIKHITKGRQLLVEGRVEVGEKGRFNVVANRIQYGQPTTESKPSSKPKPCMTFITLIHYLNLQPFDLG